MAAWAHRVQSLRCEGSEAIGAKRTCRERSEAGRFDENDPSLPSGVNFCCDAQTQVSFKDVVGCGPRPEGEPVRRREFISLLGGATAVSLVTEPLDIARDHACPNATARNI
jgi:hypothetical protein